MKRTLLIVAAVTLFSSTVAGQSWEATDGINVCDIADGTNCYEPCAGDPGYLDVLILQDDGSWTGTTGVVSSTGSLDWTASQNVDGTFVIHGNGVTSSLVSPASTTGSLDPASVIVGTLLLDEVTPDCDVADREVGDPMPTSITLEIPQATGVTLLGWTFTSDDGYTVSGPPTGTINLPTTYSGNPSAPFAEYPTNQLPGDWVVTYSFNGQNYVLSHPSDGNLCQGGNEEVQISATIEAAEAIAFCADSNLPVEITDLGISHIGGDYVLSWTTASEQDNAGFDVEMAYDGGAYEKMGFVPGAGNSLEVSSYQFVLSDRVSGRISVRLRQIDFDGSSSLSPAIEHVIDVPRPNVGPVYPNPAVSELNAMIQTPLQDNMDWAIFDLLGRPAAEGTILMSANETTSLEIPISDLSSGTYILRVRGSRFSQDRMFVKL